MVLFQKQTTQVKGKYLKKQINFKISLDCFFNFFFKNLVSEELNSKIITYLQGLKSFSSNFIQSNGTGKSKVIFILKMIKSDLIILTQTEL